MQRERKKVRKFNQLIIKTMKIRLPEFNESCYRSQAIVSFNHEHQAVEIFNDECHFLLSPMPTMSGLLRTSLWMVERNPQWKLPSEEEMSMISKYLPEINQVLFSNNYPQINDEERWWIDQYHLSESLVDVSWGTYQSISGNYTYRRNVDEACEFRLVRPLPLCEKVKRAKRY